MRRIQRIVPTLLLAVIALMGASGCSQQQNPTGKITSDEKKAMSGRPPTAAELKQAQDSEAKAIIQPGPASVQ